MSNNAAVFDKPVDPTFVTGQRSCGYEPLYKCLPCPLRRSKDNSHSYSNLTTNLINY